MRVGTWNLAGKWSDAHKAILVNQDCYVWLLTDVKDEVVSGSRKLGQVEC